MKIKLRRFQYDDVQTIHHRFDGRCLLANPMGSGKTIEVLAYCRWKHKLALPALVICPASVKYHWKQLAASTMGLSANILEGKTPPKDWQWQKSALTIINYHVLPHWKDLLLQIGFKLVVLDECQYIANPNSNRSKAAMEIGHQSPRVIGASGTPFENKPIEMWPICNIIKPEVFGSYYTFGHKYCDPKNVRGDWQFNGGTKLNRLRILLKDSVMIRRSKEDILKELPSKIRSVIPMDCRHYNEYTKARDDFISWLQNNYGNRIQNSIRAQALVQTGYLLRLAAKCKCKAVLDWSNDFLSGCNEKLLLFTVHKSMTRALSKFIKHKSITIDGSLNSLKRKQAVEQFTSDKDTRVCIGQIRACGTGTDGLQTACSHLAFTELWWTPGKHNQAEDRLHRMGQNQKVWCNYLIAVGTIEEKICDLLQHKQKRISTVLDGGPSYEDITIFDQLMQELKQNSKGKQK